MRRSKCSIINVISSCSSSYHPPHRPRHPSKIILSVIVCVVGSISRKFGGLNNVFGYVFNVSTCGIGLECDSDYDALSSNRNGTIDVATATHQPRFNWTDSREFNVHGYVSSAVSTATTVGIDNDSGQTLFKTNNKNTNSAALTRCRVGSHGGSRVASRNNSI